MPNLTPSLVPFEVPWYMIDNNWRLTDLEVRIVRCLAEGMHSKEIADCLGRRKPTIEGYIRTLYIKLNAKSRAHIVVEAMKAGLIDVS
jgi:two-component system, NarL family, response regulator YdfI